MNVVATLEHRFEQTPDGAVWTQTQYPHTFWAPYLDVFETVRVVARVKPVESIKPGWQRADGECVSLRRCRALSDLGNIFCSAGR